MSLLVEIEKQLGNFHLDVRFQAETETLALLGASAGTIGFISGLGELVGCSMRYVFGKLTDKGKHYWPMTIAGYVLDVLAVPALAW